MRLVWVIIPLVLIGIIGIQESFAEELAFDQAELIYSKVAVSAGYTPSQIPLNGYDTGNLQIRIFDILTENNITNSTIRLEISRDDELLARNLFFSDDGMFNIKINPHSACDETDAWKCTIYSGDSSKRFCPGCLVDSESQSLGISGPVFDKPGTYKLIIDAESLLPDCHVCLFAEISSFELFIILEKEKPRLSVRIQVNQGVLPQDIVCKEDLGLIFKSNGVPACVTLDTAEKLIQRGWTLNENNTDGFADVVPNENTNEKSQKPILVKDTVCQNGVFFEDPLNKLIKYDMWGLWKYLDCIYPKQLKHDLSNYDFISHEDGMKMLGVYSESDGIIERKVDFRPRLVVLGYCNPVYYHVYEYPKRVEIGQEFFINVTYSWIKPNDDWQNITESDKNIVLQLGKTARLIETQESEFEKQIRELRQDNPSNQNQKEIEQLEFQVDVFNVKLDSLYNQLVSIVEKYNDVDITTIDQLLDHKSTNTSVGFDKRQKNLHCHEPYFQLLVPKQMNFVNTDMFDSFTFSSHSDRNIAVKSVSFNNTVPQKQSFSFVVTEPISDLYQIVEIGINLETDNVFTISTDENYVYFGDNEIYHHQESHQGFRFNERGPIMLLYAEYLQENYPNADKSFIENDLDIGNKKSLEKYVKVFLEEYPEFDK